MKIYSTIRQAVKNKNKLLAVLIDPDKLSESKLKLFAEKINQSKKVNFVFVGGSRVEDGETQIWIAKIKRHISLPVVLFPGNVNQLTNTADAILFLSLISGNNPEYLIGQHIKAAPLLTSTSLEVISTGYVLIDGGVQTAVQQVSQTKALPQQEVQHIINVCKAGELLGLKLLYLEAGSGAKNEVSAKVIKKVKEQLKIPLIVGGGIKTKKQLETAYKAGADVVVIGTAFETGKLQLEEL